MRNHSSHPLIRQRGMAITEFAFIAPMLLLLVLGVTELGRAFYQYNTLTKAVRDGARYLADRALDGTGKIKDPLPATLKNETKCLVVFGNTTCTGTSLWSGLTTGNVSDVDSVDATHVRVRATYAYVPLFFGGIPTFLPVLGADKISTAFTMQPSVIMRAIGGEP